MAKSIFKNVSIKGVSIVLGEEKKVFANEPEYYNNDEEQLAKLKKMIGFDTRYWSKPETTTADLCRQAAKKLLEKLNIDKNSVDAIIAMPTLYTETLNSRKRRPHLIWNLVVLDMFTVCGALL